MFERYGCVCSLSASARSSPVRNGGSDDSSQHSPSTSPGPDTDQHGKLVSGSARLSSLDLIPKRCVLAYLPINYITGRNSINLPCGLICCPITPGSVLRKCKFGLPGFMCAAQQWKSYCQKYGRKRGSCIALQAHCALATSGPFASVTCSQVC